MRPTDGEGPFDDPAYFFEPWWPGIRALVFLEDGRVRLRAEALGDPTAAFPELDGLIALVAADGVVLDATLLVLDRRGRPSAELLRRRLAGERARRAGERTGTRNGTGPATSVGGLPGSAAVVASDLLYRDGRPLGRRPFGERRGELAALLRPAPWCLPGRGYVGEGLTVARALGDLGFRALSARRLDAPLRTGPAGDAWFRVPVREPAERALPPFLAVVRRLPLG
jgi:bifunctional non-homologous end joining protein LigD